MKKLGIRVPILLVILTNIFVLGTLYMNRSGEPDSIITLTERELSLQRRDEENSAVFLRLNWGIPVFNEYGSTSTFAEFLDEAKIKELGFSCRSFGDPSLENDCYRKHLPIQTYIVLEYEGKAWETWLRNHESALSKLNEEITINQDDSKAKNLAQKKKRFERMPITQSRLFAIDAGNDPEALRSKYPDRSRIIITPGLIKLTYHSKYSKNSKTGNKSKPRITGWIRKLLIDSIHVTSDYRHLFSPLQEKSRYSYNNTRKPLSELRPRYSVTLYYGKHYEPWIGNVTPLIQK